MLRNSHFRSARRRYDPSRRRDIRSGQTVERFWRRSQRRNKRMSMVTTSDGVHIFYKDWGKGQPIVFHHGWPLSSDDWDAQMLFFLAQGYRVIAHDRRGHGRSTQTDLGNDMDTYA